MKGTKMAEIRSGKGRGKGNSKNWIQKAIKNPGSFTQYCKRQGYKGVTKECIQKGCKSPNPTTKKRACLAKTLKKMNRKRGS
jgi:hypothetical protein